MFNYYPIFFVLCGAIHYSVSGDTDTPIIFPGAAVPYVLNYNGSDAASNAKQAFLGTTGQQNFHAAQQLFYVYGLQHWKQQQQEQQQHQLSNLVGKAGNDYLITPGMGAHKLHIRKLSWNRARRICVQEGGHLAIINSNSEEKILLRMLEEAKVTQAWLGVHDLFEEADWVTLKDQPLETAGYSRWTTKIANEPDNYGGKQHCGVLLKDGGMDDLECTASVAFFCEIPA